MARSRTKSVSINMIIAIICQVFNLLLNFIARTVFIKTLGADYLGVNGLFTNILTILSFAELGIGNAIVFSMYKPLAEKDVQKVASLMSLYKKAYTVIGVIVASVGLMVTPFLTFIIKDRPEIYESIYVLYLLFLVNTVSSYFFVYKKSLISADQKNYIVLLITEIVHFAQVVFQAIFLIATHNYIVYLIFQIAFTVIGNIIASIVANKMYPFLKQKAIPLDKKESKSIFSNVKALAVYKLGSVVLNGTDNILLSAMVGITEVGIASNYVLLNTSCNAILSKVTEAFTASVGNLNTYDDKKKQYSVFNKIMLITIWLYGFASVGLVAVSPSFITAWLGEEYLLDKITAFAIVLGFFVQGAHFAAYTYRTTLGYFKQGRLSPLIAAVLNFVLSILFCHWFGMAGIFIATPVSRFLTTGIIDPHLIYKHTFNKKPIIYHLKYFGYFVLIVAIGALCCFLVSLVNFGGWLKVIFDILIVTVVFNSIMLVVFFRTKMFRELFASAKNLLKHIKK
ncbi:MAG: sugar translocase [Clostridia bacterium]|nr:sugar translocase [Clostridia bacterium]